MAPTATDTTQKCFQARTGQVPRDWYLVDASRETLGRMATRIAVMLMGKNKPTYTPHVDCGDFVVVINAKQVRVTGAKRSQKLYRRHTGYLGGMREHTLEWMLERHPDQVIMLAVRRMIPKGRLGRQLIKKLKVFPGPDHRHGAQNPKEIHFAAS